LELFGNVIGVKLKSFKLKQLNVKGYDKYKDSDSFEECLNSTIMFLALWGWIAYEIYNAPEYDENKRPKKNE